MSEEKEYGLVLAGGGTKGAYQVGVWKAIQELGIKIKAIAGASIGSLNGALILQDDFQKMVELYKNIKITDIMKISEDIDTNKNIFNITNLLKLTADYAEQKGIENEPLRELIKKYVNFDKIYNSEIDFGMVTYSVKEQKQLEVFKKDIPKEEMINYLLASSCFPIFKPQKIGETEYFDGGLYDNTPINMLVKKGYKNIIVADIAGIGFNKKMIDKNIYLKIISPSEDLGGTFEFNKEKIEYNMKMGYLDTLKYFCKLQGHMYYFEKEEFDKLLDKFTLKTIHGLEYAANIYKIERLKIYKAEEFINLLKKKHLEAQKRYERIKKFLNLKKLKEIQKIFGSDLVICLVWDIYFNKPLIKNKWFVKAFLQDYVDAVIAIMELLN